MRDKIFFALLLCIAAGVLLVAVSLTSGAATHERYVPGVTPISEFKSQAIVGQFTSDSGGEYSDPANVGGLAKLVVAIGRTGSSTAPLRIWEQLSVDGGSSWTPFGWCLLEYSGVAYQFIAVTPSFPAQTLFRLGLIRPNDPAFSAEVTLESGDVWEAQARSKWRTPQVIRYRPGCHIVRSLDD